MNSRASSGLPRKEGKGRFRKEERRKREKRKGEKKTFEQGGGESRKKGGTSGEKRGRLIFLLGLPGKITMILSYSLIRLLQMVRFMFGLSLVSDGHILFSVCFTGFQSVDNS